MVRLLDSPRERAPWYNATGVTLYVLGMLVTASRCSGVRAPHHDAAMRSPRGDGG